MDTATMYLIGTGIQAGAKVAGGLSARDASRFNAAGLERQSAEERAAGQRSAAERRTEMERAISRARAIGAASGAGAGPSFEDILGEIGARGEYQAQSEMYLGESRARNLKDRANAARYEGDRAFMGSILEGVGTVALGGSRYDALYGPSTRSTRIPPFRTTVTYG